MKRIIAILTTAALFLGIGQATAWADYNDVGGPWYGACDNDSWKMEVHYTHVTNGSSAEIVYAEFFSRVASGITTTHAITHVTYRNAGPDNHWQRWDYTYPGTYTQTGETTPGAVAVSTGRARWTVTLVNGVICDFGSAGGLLYGHAG